MSRYIDADKLWETIKEHDYTLHDRWNTTDRGMFSIGIQQAIDEQIDEDVKPVIHAHYWTKVAGSGAGIYFCSNCNVGRTFRSNYCSNCGAKMGGELK